MAIWAEFGPGAIGSIRTSDPGAFIRLVAMSADLDDDADADEGFSIHPIKGPEGLETS